MRISKFAMGQRIERLTPLICVLYYDVGSSFLDFLVNKIVCLITPKHIGKLSVS